MSLSRDNVDRTNIEAIAPFRWRSNLEPQKFEEEEQKDKCNAANDGTPGAPEVLGVKLLCALGVLLRLCT